MAEIDGADDPREKRLRPYQPPAIEETGTFERLVLSCGHTPEEGAEGNDQCSGPRNGMMQGANS